MKYIGMPMGMWILFQRSFRDHLVSVLGINETEADRITKSAKVKYREIISKLPEYEKKDRFTMNIVNCSMFCAFLLSMERKADIAKMTDYYAQAMMTKPMKWFCRTAGKKKFTEKDIQGLKDTAALKAADSGYEARFTRCGICTLMKEYGLYEYVPAMCRLDYTMSDAGGRSVFVRQYTLASGGPYCDCGYKKKENA